MAPLRPKVLAIIPGFVPSTSIDVVQPMIDLDRQGLIYFRVALEYIPGIKDLDWANMVVFCRNAEPKYRAVLDAIQAKGIPYIYDLDDNFFEIPRDTEIGRYYRAPERQEMLTRFIKGARVVRVYSNPLLERCKLLNTETVKVTAPIDWRRIKKAGKPDTTKIRIVYVTSRVEDNLSAIFMPALKNISQEYGDRIEIYFWGNAPEVLKSASNIRFLKPVFSYNRFLGLLAQHRFDIGLAPLYNDTFHRSKTNNKFREYGACRIAGIYSDVDVYNSCVTDGRTGLLVNNDTQDWEQALRHLIVEEEFRCKIQEEAYHYTRLHYNQEGFNAVWNEHIRLALQAGAAVHEPLASEQEAFPLASEPSLSYESLTRMDKIKKLGWKGLVQYFLRTSDNVWTMFKVNLFKTL